MKEIRQILRFFDKHKHNGMSKALATVVYIEESSYRRIGARMLIMENGQWVGGISGGCLEGDVLKQAKKVMTSGIPRVTIYDTREGDPYQIGVGLGCEGKIDIFIQALDGNHKLLQQLHEIAFTRENQILITPYEDSNGTSDWVGKSILASDLAPGDLFSDGIRWVKEQKKSKAHTIAMGEHQLKVLYEWFVPNIRLIIAGTNYDIYPMLAIAREMGWDISVIGNKQKLQKDKLPAEIAFYGFGDLEAIPTDAFTAIVSMTHDYEKDKLVTFHFLEKDKGYLGLLGPRKRFERMCSEENWPEDSSSQIFNPIGLDIGSANPEEIALSAVAEIIKYFRGGEGISLKTKTDQNESATK